MADIICPETHLACWLEGKTLYVRFPDSHTITINTESSRNGEPLWPIILMGILKERARVAHAVIATGAAPVQYDIEGMMREMRIARPENFQAKPTVAIEDIDLTDIFV